MADPITWQTPASTHRAMIRQAMGLSLPIARGLLVGGVILAVVLALAPRLHPHFVMPAGKLYSLLGLFLGGLLLPLLALPLISRPGTWSLTADGLNRRPGGAPFPLAFSGMEKAWVGPLSEKLDYPGLWVTIGTGGCKYIPLPLEGQEDILHRVQEHLGPLLPPEQNPTKELPGTLRTMLLLLSISMALVWGVFLGRVGPLESWLVFGALAPLILGPGTWIRGFLPRNLNSAQNRGTLWGFNAFTAALSFLVLVLTLLTRV